MQPITRILVILSLIVGTVGVSSYATYRYYSPKAFANGRSDGYSQGYKNAVEEKSAAEMTSARTVISLREENDKLRSDNIKLVNAINSRSSAPTTCYTHNYSTIDSSTTTCY